VLGISMLIVGAAYIAAGVVGIVQKSAKVCFIVAIVVMAVCAADTIYNIATGGKIVSSLFSLVLPVLYLIGAIQYKKAWDAAAVSDTQEAEQTPAE